VNVAVVVPTYNRAPMVVRAVESVLRQRHPARCVVVDDGSTDDTLARLAPFARRIDVVRQENAERGAARNRGAAHAADADAFVFLDADDVLREDHVASLVATLAAHPDAPLAACRVVDTDAHLRPYRRWPGPGNERVDLEGFLFDAAPVPIASLVRAGPYRAVGGFPEDRNLQGSEDWVFYARLLCLGAAPRTPDFTFVKRDHPANSMSDGEAQEATVRASTEAFVSLPPGAGTGTGLPGEAHARWADAANRRAEVLGRRLIRVAATYYGAGEMGEVRRLLDEAADLFPPLRTHALVRRLRLRSRLGRRPTRWLRALKRRVQRAGERVRSPGRDTGADTGP
jgi:glycosyltransferase involved in cell wall biosynthesis